MVQLDTFYSSSPCPKGSSISGSEEAEEVWQPEASGLRRGAVDLQTTLAHAIYRLGCAERRYGIFDRRSCQFEKNPLTLKKQSTAVVRRTKNFPVASGDSPPAYWKEGVVSLQRQSSHLSFHGVVYHAFCGLSRSKCYPQLRGGGGAPE